MKNIRSILVLVAACFMLSSCGLWNKVFGPKYGCPSNGRNVGAEKLLSGDMSKKEARQARKAKFKG